MNADTALAQALPELRAAERSLRAAAAREHITYDVADFGGMRTESDTTRIMGYRDADYAVYVRQAKAAGRVPVAKDKWRPIAPFGKSYHNYGAAFDVRVTGTPTGMTAAQALGHLGALAPSVGLRWGAAFGDTPHFELATTLDDVRARWAKFTSGAASLGALLMPGIEVTPSHQATVATIRPQVARSPLAVATIGTGAVVAAALLTWLVVRRFTE